MGQQPGPDPGDESLEAPAYLGRPFPGRRRSGGSGSGAVRGLFSLVIFAAIGFAATLTSGNTVAAVICLVVGTLALAAAVYVIRSEVLREIQR